MAPSVKYPTLDFRSGSCELMYSNNQSPTYKGVYRGIVHNRNTGNNHGAKQWGAGCLKGGPYIQGNTT